MNRGFTKGHENQRDRKVTPILVDMDRRGFPTPPEGDIRIKILAMTVFKNYNATIMVKAVGIKAGIGVFFFISIFFSFLNIHEASALDASLLISYFNSIDSSIFIHLPEEKIIIATPSLNPLPQEVGRPEEKTSGEETDFIPPPLTEDEHEEGEQSAMKIPSPLRGEGQSLPPKYLSGDGGELREFSTEQDNDSSNPVITKVSSYIDFFTTKRGHSIFQAWLNQAGPYIPFVKDILREEGIPEDLALLPLIESGFNVNARSPKQAAGMWQFMASTGAMYGLKVNKWVDERRDPVKSTRAAARHLKDLYNTFGDWPLALASYNAGSGKVKKAIERTGSADYWEIEDTRALKPETQNYVPKFMAAVILAKNPDDFGFTITDGPAIKYDVIEVPGGIDLNSITKISDADYEELRKLNPELKSQITPSVEIYYTLRVPEGAGPSIVETYNKLPLSKRGVYREYRVRKGDTVSKIAKKYRVDKSTIRNANNLNKKYRIKPGDYIVVPLIPSLRESDMKLIATSEFLSDII
ncbi:MAG: transglycosylase SLT domain-containing protein [Nitrospirae bacterium]|nr:transglycosylase SLT domain-containing protein [Nitrospirota bacterium]